jgi:hypothetical protein
MGSDEEIGLASGAPMSTAHRRWRRTLLAVSFTQKLSSNRARDEPSAPAPPPLSFARGSAALLTGSKVNALLLFVPIAFLVRGDAAVFGLACLALLPLAALLGDATEVRRTTEEEEARLRCSTSYSWEEDASASAT